MENKPKPRSARYNRLKRTALSGFCPSWWMDEPANLGRSGPLSPDPRLLFLPAAIAPLWAAGKTANPAGRTLPIVGPRQRATRLVAARLGVPGDLVVGKEPQADLQPVSKSTGEFRHRFTV